MYKDNECKIIQDLLLGYVDNTLNKETNKLVEEHLSKCNDCKTKFLEIKKDIESTEKEQQKEIDYLKKIRRKSKIKSFVMALLIIIFIIFVYYFIKFLKISNIYNKQKESLKSNNIFIEQVETMNNGTVAIHQKYHKDNKNKEVFGYYEEDGTFVKLYTMYSEDNSNERITLYENEKKVIIEKGDILKSFNGDNKEQNSFISMLGKAFLMSIQKDTFQIGKEYYILKYQYDPNAKTEYWIDKETGLLLRSFDRNCCISYIPGTNIIKEMNDRVVSYNYEFNKVTDEDVVIPDYSNYTIETSDYDNLLNKNGE